MLLRDIIPKKIIAVTTEQGICAAASDNGVTSGITQDRIDVVVSAQIVIMG